MMTFDRLLDAPRRMTCEFCSRENRPMLPTQHGLICDLCVQVMVEIVCSKLVEEPVAKARRARKTHVRLVA